MRGREFASPVASPIKPQNWLVPVLSHPDHRFAAYIYAGLTAGLRIGFDRKGSPLAPAPNNHPLPSVNKQAVCAYIREEAGWTVPGVHVSPIGLIPKSHQLDKWWTSPLLGTVSMTGFPPSFRQSDMPRWTMQLSISSV